MLNKGGLSLSDATNLATTLNTIPGVTMQSGTYLTNRIVIRGMGSRTPYNTNRIRTYLNEIPMTSSDGVSTPEEIDLLSLEKIEVVKGPSSALYGSGLGGSLNMYTPEKSGNEGNIDLQYGSFNTLKAGASGTLNSGKARLWSSLSHLNSDGYRENNDYSRTTLLSTARWMEQSWSVNATLLLVDVRGGIPSSLGKTMFEESPESAAPAWKAIEGFKEYSRGVASVSFNRKITRALTGNFALFGKYNDNYERRPFNNLDDQSLSGGVRGKVSYRSKKTELTAGVELISEVYQWKLDKDNLILNENSENRNHLNVFGIMYYKPVKELNISIAGAVNHITYKLTDEFPSNGDQSGSRDFPTIVSPRLGINYAPGDIFSVYASAGHGFSLPLKQKNLLQIYTGINNLTGTQYASMLIVNAVGFGNTEPRYYYPGLPRHYYGGIRLSF